MISDHNQFELFVIDYYRQHNRDLPWRTPSPEDTFDPYKIMVSEIMLQQTQVNRVIQKYQDFLAVFPSIKRLASANLSEVLLLWSGLGYNRRAKFLLLAAQKITSDFNGMFPNKVEDIQTLPGIGYNTAAAIATYAYNQKHVFVETNIRTVYIYHFFMDEQSVDDEMLKPSIAQSLTAVHSMGISYREWYWALMDYGTFLKKTVGNLSRQSKHYQKQSTFVGSRRQLRGNIVRTLLSGPQTIESLKRHCNDERFTVWSADYRKP